MAGRNYVCLITADREWEDMVKGEIGNMYVIKTLRDGLFGEPKLLSMRNIIENASKVIVGFSENQTDLVKLAAYMVVIEMIEKQELDARRFIPVMLTARTVIPNAFDVFVPAKSFENDFIPRLLEALREGNDENGDGGDGLDLR